jgi:hypothetical protein
MAGITGELMHHLDMVLRVVTSVRIMSGELDDVSLAVSPRARAMSARSSEPCRVHEDDGQRTVTTVESDIALHEWSIPGPQSA